MDAILSLSIDIPLDTSSAFDVLIDELSLSWAHRGLNWNHGPQGELTQRGAAAVGETVAWEPPRRLAMRWHAPLWSTSTAATVEWLLAPIEGGTRVSLTCRNWDQMQGDGGEVVAWIVGEVMAPLALAVSPERLGNWVTDRRARRPSGPQSRGVYRDPLYHYPNFKVILEELNLQPADELIDIGCGGGALLKAALARGCRAAGIDHSADMVRLATRENQQAVGEGRLVVRQASADHLPFEDARFTCASMTGVLGFLPDARAAFREIHRVLRPGGRMVVFGSDPALRGTPAAPEPIASHLHFYDDQQLAGLACDARFGDAKVVRRDLLAHAREVGVPEEHLVLFGKPAPFLIATKARA